MNIITHTINEITIAEIQSDQWVLDTAEKGADLVGSLYFSGFDRVIVHQKNVHPDFYHLKNKLAGEILQKFSNYRIRLAIIGPIETKGSQSLEQFIRESNQGRQINFLETLDSALLVLSN